jgi:4-amino-4-deoxy-L-arabinose transferase-like glycosyltransferase
VTWINRYWKKLRPNEKRFILILWLLAVFLRLGYAFTVDLIPADMTGIDMDAVEYDYLGWSIAEGHGVTDRFGNPNSTRFPAYLYFLGAIYFIFGRDHQVVLVIQALLGSLTPLLIYFTARQIFTDKTSRIAGILAAIYPVWIWYVGWLMTENLFLFFLNLLIYLTVSLGRSIGWKKLTLMGIVTGLLSLTRGVGLPFLGIIPLFVFLRLKGTFATKAGRALMVLGAALITMAPWTLYNYNRYGEIMLPSCEGPAVFWLALNADKVSVDEWYEPEPAFAYLDSVGRENATSEEFYRRLAQNNYFGVFGLQALFGKLYPDEAPPKTDVEGSRRLGDKAKVQIQKEPIAWIVKSVIQVGRFWHVLDERGRYINGYAFIIPFFFAGFWMTRRRFRDLIPLYIFPAVLYAISILFFADARFRMPFEGVFLIVGAYAIERFIERFHRPIWAYAILAAFFVFNYYMRLHSPEVRSLIRTVIQALGVPIGEA